MTEEDKRRFTQDLRALFMKYRIAGAVIYARPTRIGRCDKCKPPHPVFMEGFTGTELLLPVPTPMGESSFAYGYATVQQLWEMHQDDPIDKLLCKTMERVHTDNGVPPPKRDGADDYADEFTGHNHEPVAGGGFVN